MLLLEFAVIAGTEEGILALLPLTAGAVLEVAMSVLLDLAHPEERSAASIKLVISVISLFVFISIPCSS